MQSYPLSPRVSQLVKNMTEGTLPDHPDQDDLISQLINYECWSPLTQYLNQLTNHKDQDVSLHYYGILLQVFLKQTNDLDKTIATTKQMIDKWKLSFQKTYFVLESKKLVNNHSPLEEAKLFEDISSVFINKSDRVRCLLRLALIYDKKLQNDRSLRNTCQKILKLDPTNLKALQYRSDLLTQEKKWEELSELYEDYVELSPPQEDKERILLELANLYLVTLNQPQKTIDLINKHHLNERFDTNELSYEAYLKLKDYKMCHTILDQYTKQQKTPTDQSILFYKKGFLHYTEKDFPNAETCLKKSHDADPSFLDSLELLVRMNLEQKKFSDANRWVEALSQKIETKESKKDLNVLVKKINEALNDV